MSRVQSESAKSLDVETPLQVVDVIEFVVEALGPT